MKVNFKYLLTISLVTALGGLLFGFDISVISGTIPFLQDYFAVNELVKNKFEFNEVVEKSVEWVNENY